MVTLVVGATGFLGSEICRRLVAQGKPVRALVRSTSDENKVEELRRLGATMVYADLRMPESLLAACQGVTNVISTATTTFSRQPGDSIEATDRDGQLNLVKAAKESGIGHFVFISTTGNMDPGHEPSPLTVAKRTVEQALQSSGMVYTILRPSYFMEVWLSPAIGFDPVNGTATIFGSGRNPISWVSLYTVADFAVQSLDNPAGRNAVVELGGPEALTPLAVVKIFEEIGGRQIAVTHVRVEALAAQYSAATDSMQKTYVALWLSCAAGDPIDMKATRSAYSVPLRSVQEYAKSVLAPEKTKT